MSKNIKMTIWIVIILVLIVAGIGWYMSSRNGNGTVAPTASQSNAGQSASGTAQNTNAVANTGLSTGTSDASLNQDLSAIDGQLGGLASDTASVDQSLTSQSAGQ